MDREETWQFDMAIGCEQKEEWTVSADNQGQLTKLSTLFGAFGVCKCIGLLLIQKLPWLAQRLCDRAAVVY